MNAPIVIIGAGQAGLQTAEALRSEGHDGPVLMLGAEAHAPYHRPPLSKAYLLGDYAQAQLTIRSPQALEKKHIEFRPGVTVSAIDRAANQEHRPHGWRDSLPGKYDPSIGIQRLLRSGGLRHSSSQWY